VPTMTIKNIPEPIYHSLKRSAQANHRSLNGETIACLERSLGLSTQPSPISALGRIDGIRDALKGMKLTDRMLRKARVDGRP
jgi:plasmid stability protein